MLAEGGDGAEGAEGEARVEGVYCLTEEGEVVDDDYGLLILSSCLYHQAQGVRTSLWR